MNQKEWKSRIQALPKGLTVFAAAKHLGLKYSAVRFWLQKFGYKYADGRSQAWPDKRRRSVTKIRPEKINWKLSNIEIAKKLNVSRERIRQLRNKNGK